MGSIAGSLPISRMPYGLPQQANNTGATMPGASPLPQAQPPGGRLFAQGANNQTYGAQAPKQPLAPAAPLPKPAAAPPAPAGAPSATPTAGAGGGYTPDGMRSAIGNNLMGLLQGNNQAADLADRRAMTQLNQMQKTGDAGLARQAAAMGIQPGDPRYQTFLNQNRGAQESFGSRVLGENAQRRLEDQNRNLQTAAAFNQAQQTHDLNTAKFGEDTRRYDQDFGESQRRDNRDYGESVRRYDQDFGENTRRYDQDFGESTRRFDIGQGNIDREFGEDTRRFDIGQSNNVRDFGESARRFDVGQGNWQTEFGEGQRRFDIGQGNWQTEFGEGQRQFDVGQANNIRDFSEDTRRYDQNFGENRRLADQSQDNWRTELGQRTLESDRNFNESMRQFDTSTANQQKAQEVNSLFDIINNPLSSGGEVEAAKNRLFSLQGGLDPNLLAKQDPTYGTQARQEVEDWVRSAFPGRSDAEYEAMVAQRMGDLDSSTFGALNKSNLVDGTGGAPAPTKPEPSLGQKILTGAGDVLKTMAPGGALLDKLPVGLPDLAGKLATPIATPGNLLADAGGAVLSGGKKLIRSVSDWF